MHGILERLRKMRVFLAFILISVFVFVKAQADPDADAEADAAAVSMTHLCGKKHLVISQTLG